MNPEQFLQAEVSEQKEMALPKYGTPKSWLDILAEVLDELPENEKLILQKKLAGENLDPAEQSQIDKFRNKFWLKHFGTPFAIRDRTHSEKKGGPLSEQKNGKDNELSGVYKNFAENFENYVIYEDDDILVINKPAGISTQGRSPKEPYSIASFISSVRPGTAIVHRIDKETSGVLILGKTSEIRKILIKNWKSSEREKWYIAVSNGDYEEKVIGTILPIEEKGAGARVSIQPAKLSSTYFNKIMGFEKNGKKYSVLRVRIHSGRKHQIRVSLRHLGFPIVGDKLYNKDSRNAYEGSRQLLHAFKLVLAHPRTGEIQEFIAPIPDDIREFTGSFFNDFLY